MASRGESPGFDHGDLPPLDEQRRMIAETRRKFNEWLSGELGKARGNGS
jgi:N-methylhydantoinase B